MPQAGVAQAGGGLVYGGNVAGGGAQPAVAGGGPDVAQQTLQELLSGRRSAACRRSGHTGRIPSSAWRYPRRDELQNAEAQAQFGISQGNLGISEQQLGLQGQGLAAQEALAGTQQGIEQQQYNLQMQQYPEQQQQAQTAFNTNQEALAGRQQLVPVSLVVPIDRHRTNFRTMGSSRPTFPVHSSRRSRTAVRASRVWLSAGSVRTCTGKPRPYGSV